jgi:hypothetical protein
VLCTCRATVRERPAGYERTNNFSVIVQQIVNLSPLSLIFQGFGAIRRLRLAEKMVLLSDFLEAWRSAMEFHTAKRKENSGFNPDRGRDTYCYAPTGWPEVVAHLRLPQNVACGFPALRSSDGKNPGSNSVHSPDRMLSSCLPHYGIGSATSTTIDFGAMLPCTVVSACNLPVYASQWPSPNITQDLVRGCELGFAAASISGDWIP